MDVIQQLQPLLNSSYSIFVAAAATLAVLMKILSHIIKAMDWHDKHFVRKRLSRLRDIRSGATNTRLIRYLDDATELELFRIASGVSTSRSKMEYLLELDETGRWNRTQLRSLSKFVALQPDSKTPVLSVTSLDKLSAWTSGISTLLILFLGAWCLNILVRTGSPILGISGLLLFGVAILFARYLATDCIDYLIVTRAQRYLSLKAQMTETDQ